MTYEAPPAPALYENLKMEMNAVRIAACWAAETPALPVTAGISWEIPHTVAPVLMLVRRPAKRRIANMPDKLPKTPMVVVMMVYSKALVTPPCCKK
jgi:hypothetical protein